MKVRKLIRTLIILLVLATNISCDQLSKNIVRQKINYNTEIKLLNGHLTITKVENTGAFLSIGNNLPQPIKLILLGIIPLTALCAAIFYVIMKERLSRIRVIGMCFLIGGGIGNIADRMIHGSVTDFVHINFGIFQTGIFNMADVSIMTGILLILFNSYFNQLLSKIDNQRM